MARFRASFGRILTIGGLAAATGTVAVYQTQLTDKVAAYAQNVDNSTGLVDDASKPPQTKWDNDWDRRSKTFRELTKTIRNKVNDSNDDDILRINIGKSGETVCENGDENNEQIIKRSKATRHLIFVRHGQYNQGKKVDEEKTLTELGRCVFVSVRRASFYF